MSLQQTTAIARADRLYRQGFLTDWEYYRQIVESYFIAA